MEIYPPTDKTPHTLRGILPCLAEIPSPGGEKEGRPGGWALGGALSTGGPAMMVVTACRVNAENMFSWAQGADQGELSR